MRQFGKVLLDIAMIVADLAENILFRLTHQMAVMNVLDHSGPESKENGNGRSYRGE